MLRLFRFSLLHTSATANSDDSAFIALQEAAQTTGDIKHEDIGSWKDIDLEEDGTIDQWRNIV